MVQIVAVGSNAVQEVTAMQWLAMEIPSHVFTVLIFFRGGWCRECRSYLESWSVLAARIRSHGGGLFGITAQDNELCLRQQTEQRLGFDLVGDQSNSLAQKYGVHITSKSSATFNELIKYASRSAATTNGQNSSSSSSSSGTDDYLTALTVHGFAYGVSQPAVIVLDNTDSVKYRWISFPKAKNEWGATQRISADYILDSIQHVFQDRPPTRHSAYTLASARALRPESGESNQQNGGRNKYRGRGSSFAAVDSSAVQALTRTASLTNHVTTHKRNVSVTTTHKTASESAEFQAKLAGALQSMIDNPPALKSPNNSPKGSNTIGSSSNSLSKREKRKPLSALFSFLATTSASANEEETAASLFAAPPSTQPTNDGLSVAGSTTNNEATTQATTSPIVLSAQMKAALQRGNEPTNANLFEECLRDPQIRAMLHTHLSMEYNAELIDFLTEVDALRQQLSSSDNTNNDWVDVCMRIYDQFISSSAENEINISAAVRSDIEKRIAELNNGANQHSAIGGVVLISGAISQSAAVATKPKTALRSLSLSPRGDCDVFDEAYKMVKQMIFQDGFARFIRSPAFRALTAQ